MLSEKIDLTWLTTENIKQNKMGEILENETFYWLTKKKQDDPAHQEERAYHMFSIGLITNEIFRRVEPHGRTMAEYLKQEFPGLDVYSAIKDTDTDILRRK